MRGILVKESLWPLVLFVRATRYEIRFTNDELRGHASTKCFANEEEAERGHKRYRVMEQS